jgi:hypothetical protein
MHTLCPVLADEMECLCQAGCASQGTRNESRLGAGYRRSANVYVTLRRAGPATRQTDEAGSREESNRRLAIVAEALPAVSSTHASMHA